MRKTSYNYMVSGVEISGDDALGVFVNAIGGEKQLNKLVNKEINKLSDTPVGKTYSCVKSFDGKAMRILFTREEAESNRANAAYRMNFAAAAYK